MKLAIVGTGYVGLVTGACFADGGNDVICVDIDCQRVEGLKQAQVPFYEPGLADIVARNLREERLTFTLDLAAAVKKSLVVFICVGTPSKGDGSADLSAVMKVAAEIGRAMDGYKIVVNKSTVPVGTGDAVRAEITRHTQQEFDVVSNPEFLKEGAAIDDFLKPDRVVVGCDNVRVAALMKELYAPFVRTGKPILTMDIRSAEMTKYAANCLLATKVTFMNEMASLCERVGADIEMVRIGIGSDSRIGPSFLFPGAGYGGSCFPKDVRAMIDIGRAAGYEPRITAAVDQANEAQKRHFGEKIVGHFGGQLAGKKIAIWGLSFKPKTDDMREAPSIAVMEMLLEKGARVAAYDPEAMANAQKIFGSRIQYCRNNYEALEGADALAILTEWSVFRNPDFGRMKGLLKTPLIFDGRNLYDLQEMKQLGFHYFCVGRPAV